MEKKLNKYREKRDFKITDEPKGRPNRGSGGNIFVIQMHNARNLHFDFRIESGDALKSWALPKGIPKKGDKFLAVMTEDHPLEYAKFEGTIPKDEYGGGTVLVWDIGTFQNKTLEKGRLIQVKRALDLGKLHLMLKGKKLSGEYVLIRLRKQEKNWIMMRTEGEKEKRNNLSALSGKTIKEIERNDNG